MAETPEYQPPAAVAGFAVDRAVAELVERAEGPAGFAQVPPYRGASYTRKMPRPVPALRAALLVRHVAQGKAQDAIRAARAAGTSWAELADTLGVDGGEAAYRVAVGPDDGWAWYQRQDVYWRCSACAELVTDSGPYEAHPANNETGHADGCARHLAEIAAYQATWDEL